MRLTKWLITNAIFLGLGIAALILKDAGLQNIFVFWCWLTAILATLTCFNEPYRQLERRRGHPVSMTVDFIFDLTIIGLLVYRGDFLTASVYFWGTCCLQNIHYKPPTLKELSEQ